MEDHKTKQQALDKLQEIGEHLQQVALEYEVKCDEYWNNLSYDDRLKAFYCVTKLIKQGDMVDQGTYRYVLYDVFGFGPDSYGIGMDSGYLDIHNRLFDGGDWQNMKSATRFEVIDGEGRKYSNWNVEKLTVQFQDNDKTVKFFINGERGVWEE